MVTQARLRENAALGLLVLGLGLAGWAGYHLVVVARENAAIADPRNLELDEDTAPELILAKAQALDLGGDYREALRLYHTLRNDPSPAFRQRVHYNMGTIYLREAAGLWNSHGVLEYARVNALVTLAKENLKEALRLKPDDQDARFNLEYAFRITPPPKEKEKANWQGTKSSVFSTLPGIPGGAMKARVGRPFAGLAAAAVLTLLAWADPRIPLERPVFRYLFVLDITQSMNARDYHLEGLPADRLGFAKAAIRRAITDLPCGSQAGLGLFTTQNVELLFEPLEVCRHAGVIEDVLEHVDWRMAWAADSFIAQGLNAALRIVKKRDPAPRLVFLSDGQQTPEDPVRPELKIKPGEVQGLIVGVGDVKPVPIPRLDRENRPLGFWEKADILAPVTTTAYLDASADTSHRRGNDGSLYLSWLHETELRDFADTAGLGYLRLDTPERLSLALRDPALGELRVVPTGIGWTLAFIAWLLVIWPHLVPDPRARHVSG